LHDPWKYFFAIFLARPQVQIKRLRPRINLLDSQLLKKPGISLTQCNFDLLGDDMNVYFKYTWCSPFRSNGYQFPC
jgi:hypothetical protein